MQDSRYLQFIEKPVISTSICDYCGSPLFLGKAKSALCGLCEGYHSHKESGAINPNIGKLSQIQLLIDQSKVEEAKNSLDALILASNDLNLLFGAANIYKTLSDIKYYDRNYNRKGFMEENSTNVYQSLDLTSKSKEMFYKAIRMVADQTKNSPDDKLLYLSFISYMKLKRTIDAERILSSMKAKKSSEKEYANMVYLVETGKEEGHQESIRLMEKGNTNAVYYLARYYVGKKRLKEAKEILDKLTAEVRMPDAVFLLRKINRQIEETRL